MIEMTDEEYGRSGLLAVLWFVLGVPFTIARRRRTVVAWMLTIPAAVLYELFAVPLVVGSVLGVVVVTSPMLVLAGVLRLVSGETARDLEQVPGRTVADHRPAVAVDLVGG
jgi:hypothetical protein